MSTTLNTESLLEEIELFVQYGVPKDQMVSAKALVDRYRGDLLVLRLLHEHYSTLPGDREEAVNQIAVLKQKQGVYLLVVSSDTFSSVYLVSMDNLVWLCEYGEEITTEVLAYFDFTSQKEFGKTCKPVEELEEFIISPEATLCRCSVCNVLEGELHLFGCLVEVCPWCDGQVNSCNCRFEQLETDDIEDEEQLEEFFDLLTAKGRVTFEKSQSPAYPGTSSGIDGETSKK